MFCKDTVEKDLHRSQPSKKKSVIHGARHIWGTFKSTSTKAIENAVSSLTSISPKSLVIKRKHKYVNSGCRSMQRWWFVVRGDEAVLQELDSCCDSIALQTCWQLTPLVQYIPVRSSHPDNVCHNGDVDHNGESILDPQSSTQSIVQQPSPESHHHVSLESMPTVEQSVSVNTPHFLQV